VVYVWAVSGGLTGGWCGGVFRNKAVWYLLWLRVRMMTPVCGQVVLLTSLTVGRHTEELIGRYHYSKAPFLLLCSGGDSIHEWRGWVNDGVYYAVVLLFSDRGNDTAFRAWELQNFKLVFLSAGKTNEADLLWRKAPFPRQGCALNRYLGTAGWLRLAEGTYLRQQK
jgi:hypothetical protein